MQILILIIGLLMVLYSLLFLIKPEAVKKILEFIIKGKRIYGVGIIKIALGMIFLVAASKCSHPWIIILFGVLTIVGTILFFAMKLSRLKSILQWHQKQNKWVIRFFGLLTMAIGLIICYAAVID